MRHVWTVLKKWTVDVWEPQIKWNYFKSNYEFLEFYVSEIQKLNVNSL